MPIAGLLPDAASTVRPAADLNGDGVLDFSVASRRGEADPVDALALSAIDENGSTTWLVVPFATESEGTGPSAALASAIDEVCQIAGKGSRTDFKPPARGTR